MCGIVKCCLLRHATIRIVKAINKGKIISSLFHCNIPNIFEGDVYYNPCPPPLNWRGIFQVVTMALYVNILGL